jgi:hypothetical protein
MWQQNLNVGIRDRDYMKRPSDDGQGASSNSKAEEIAQKILSKFPKILMLLGIGLLVIIVVALIILKLSGSHH